jgi:hypothetical protein
MNAKLLLMVVQTVAARGQMYLVDGRLHAALLAEVTAALLFGHWEGKYEIIE